MKAHRVLLGAALAALAVACDNSQDPTSPSLASSREPAVVGVNVVLRSAPTGAMLAELGRYGTVGVVMKQINAVTMIAKAENLAAIRSLSYVGSAEPDQERQGAPIDLVAAESFDERPGMWNLDMVDVTKFSTAPATSTNPFARDVEADGAGVYVGVLDTGLLDSWRAYFPEQRIASQYAIAFTGGGALDMGTAAEQPNKWEHDQNSHGTHVVSTILGFNRFSPTGQIVSRTGVAPQATVIPVKVLNQNGSGWSSAVAAGILYIASLKAEGGPLHKAGVVINMSLGGSESSIEKAAIDEAIKQGVIVVAAMGNGGVAGSHFPGSYGPVIGAANIGWTKQWTSCGKDLPAAAWYNSCDVAENEPGKPAADVYVSTSSGRPDDKHEADVAAPGSWVVGPYQLNSATGKLTYFYLSGTSMSSPHVAGVAALLLQRSKELNQALDQAKATEILHRSAFPIPDDPDGVEVKTSTGTAKIIGWKARDAGYGLVSAREALKLLQ